MKEGIHPAYQVVAVTCACGNAFETRSVYPKTAMPIDVCSHCHPFYTGKQKTLGGVGGRISKFEKRFGGAPAAPSKSSESKE